MMSHFSFTALKIFSFSLAFDILTMMCLGMAISVFVLLGVWKHNGWKLPNLMKNTLHVQEAQQILFSGNFSLSSFSAPFTHTLVYRWCLIFLWSSVYVFVILFALCSSDCMLSIDPIQVYWSFLLPAQIYFWVLLVNYLFRSFPTLEFPFDSFKIVNLFIDSLYLIRHCHHTLP